MRILIFSLLLSLYAHAIEATVSVAWLEKNLGKENLRIVEVSSKESYELAHIPGATHTSIEKWRSNNGVYLSVRDAKELQAEIQKHGIDAASEVVLYADITAPIEFLKASYIFWALNYAGIENVAILDGGKQAWIAAKAKTTQSASNVKPSKFVVRLNPDLIASREYVEQNLYKLPMIDARPSDNYLGITPTNTVRRDGHISGAMSYSWNYSVNKDFMLKEKNKLDTLFAKGYNLDKNKEVLVYCTGGLETSYNYYVLSGVLGYKHVRLYDASMKEWGNRDDTSMTQYRYEVFGK